jgi:hypothetical protein
VGQEHQQEAGLKEEAALVKSPPPLPVRFLVAGTMSGVGLLSLLYLLNPGWGWIELFPDNLPIVGNLDEAGATALLLMVLSYWGFDLTRLGRGIGSWSKGTRALPAPEASASKKVSRNA